MTVSPRAYDLEVNSSLVMHTVRDSAQRSPPAEDVKDQASFGNTISQELNASPYVEIEPPEEK